MEKMYQINITEQMVNAEPQEIITNDNLNARVDAQVYFKVKEDEASIKNSLYHVNNYKWQRYGRNPALAKKGEGVTYAGS